MLAIIYIIFNKMLLVWMLHFVVLRATANE